MATTIEYNIKVNDNGATQSLGQLESELSQINEELRDVPIGSKAFEDLSKRSQKLTKDLEGAQTALRGVTDEDKIRGFQGSIDILAGSVSGLTGAVGLLGIESEEFEKYTAYAANAIAFSEGIRTAAQGMVDLRGFLKAAGIQATIFGKVTKRALISTGIGALVVALGTIVAYWEEITDFISGASKEQEKYNQELDESFTTSEGIVSVLESQVSLEEAKGEDTLETNKKLLDQLKLQIDITNELIAQKQIQLADEEEQNKQLTFWEKTKLAIFSATGAYGAFAETLSESVNPESEKTRELQNEINELQIRSNGLQQKYLGISQTVTTQEEMRAGATEALAITTRGLADVTGGLNVESQIVGATIDDTTAALIKNKNEKELAALATQVQISKEQQYQEGLFASAEAITNLSAVLGAESAAGKALAISTAIINTYLGVTEALKQKSTLPSPFDVITKIANVATILATGFKAVKAIKATPAGGTGGGVPSGGGFRSGAAAPAGAPSVADLIPTGISPEEAVASSAPVRAYVVSGDITSSQEAEAKIQSKRTID